MNYARSSDENCPGFFRYYFKRRFAGTMKRIRSRIIDAGGCENVRIVSFSLITVLNKRKKFVIIYGY